jgi:hypothetical protein
LVKPCIINTSKLGNTAMYKYAIWARINAYQTVNTVVWAGNDYDAKMIAESQFGQGNVLNYSRIYE